MVAHERSNGANQSERKTSVNSSRCFAIQEHEKVPETATEDENKPIEKERVTMQNRTQHFWIP